VVGFRRYLNASFSEFLHNFFRSVRAIISGGFWIYLLNFAVALLYYYAIREVPNPNDAQVYDMLLENSHATVVIAVLLGPLVEETIFRGLIFGGIRKKNRLLAYAVSSLLFGLLHIWQFAVIYSDWSLLILILQYIPPALGLAWCYEKSGTIWSSVLLHMFINGLSMAYYLL
jgi:hypothetical protein